MSKRTTRAALAEDRYRPVFNEAAEIVGAAREHVARSANAAMTAAYWLIGRQILEFEQAGKGRAQYRRALVEKLAEDLTKRFGRGFSRRNIAQMRLFYQMYPPAQILQTVSGKTDFKSILQTVSAESALSRIANCFPLPWSAYVRLLSITNPHAREFYETEAVRGGWSVRQLDRQINTQFYERTALSKNKAALLTKGQVQQPEDVVRPEEAIKDPYVLKFLDLKDEYSETDLEDTLIRHLESFLLELGADFCFMGRQRRLRIGNTWYRVDLVFFHRRLQCLVIIDLKLGAFTHADAGQMHLYLNYAREHWVRDGENPPVGLILCAQKDDAVARYAHEGLPNKVMAAEYRTTLPDEELLASEIERTRQLLNARRTGSSGSVVPEPRPNRTKVSEGARRVGQ